MCQTPLPYVLLTGQDLEITGLDPRLVVSIWGQKP
jgi:hypothetical protein